MMTVNEWRRQHLFQAKAREAMQEHSYAGTRNTWYGEPIHQCSCGDFESHERYQVEAHIKAEQCAKEAERIEESYLEMLADLVRGEEE